MKTKLPLIISAVVAVAITLNLSAQVYNNHAGEVPAIELSSEYTPDYSLDINVKKNVYGTYTVRVFFSTLENYSGASLLYQKVVYNDGLFLRLRRTTPTQQAYCQYTYRYTRGRLDPKVDTNFVYRLPYAIGKSARESDLTTIGQSYFKEEAPKTWKAMQFRLSEGDTIYAARKGEVIEIVDKHDPIESEGNVRYNRSSNSVLIEHADGSFGEYSVLKRGTMMVKEGDIVYPDTPLALAGSLNSTTVQLRFKVFYKASVNENKDSKNANDWYEYVYVNPRFATADGVVQTQSGKSYTPVLPAEVLTSEMTKKEIKQRQKK